jgi:opacity protein-like surface antigen
LAAGETRTGWTVGGGVEWAFFNNWSAKLEYDFYNFRARNVTLTGFSKRIGSRYVSGRTRAWLKTKNPNFERS